MKLRSILAASLGLSLLAFQAQAADDMATNEQASVEQVTVTEETVSSDATTLTDQQDRISYTIGVDMGENLKAQGLDINPDMLARGIKDAVNENDLLMSKQEMEDTLLEFQKELIAKQEQAMKEVSEKNAQVGSQFLTENKAKPGVVTMDSGLQYKVLQAGDGAKPAADDYVTVDYEGKLIDGTVFDSTYSRGKPATFKVSQVIPGWQEALQEMPMGATWELYIPANLAYGERGIGGPIGPNETLIFKVHLISIGQQDQDNVDGSNDQEGA